MCRYRKDLIQNLSPEKLRDVKETIETVKLLETKTANILKLLEKEKLLTDDISRNIKAARSLEELEHLSQLYKPAAKGSLFERAQKLGLEPAAENILYGKQEVNLSKLVKPNVDGLTTFQEVGNGIKNIMSHLIAKNELVLNEVRELRARFGVVVTTTQVKAKDDKGKGSAKTATSNTHKFENYFNFSCPVSRIKPHQILAINRGESLKVFFKFYARSINF